MKKEKQRVAWISLILVVSLGLILQRNLQPKQLKFETIITHVIDGDTVVTKEGTKIRLIGIDTPETGKCYSDIATEYMSRLVLNKHVQIKTDVQMWDKYNRLLGYIWTDSDILANEHLVISGHAKVMTIEPNTKHAKLLNDAQRYAVIKDVGLWKYCF